MRIVFIVFLVCIAYSTSFPTLHENDDDALDLEVRSILNHLEQQEVREIESDEDSEQDESSFQMSKRQGGHNIIDQQSKCEIVCIGKQRKAETGGGKSVKDAAKACRNICNAQSKKRAGTNAKKQTKGKAAKRSFLNLREDDDDENENDSEDQSESSEEQQRREFFELLQEQLENENNE